VAHPRLLVAAALTVAVTVGAGIAAREPRSAPGVAGASTPGPTSSASPGSAPMVLPSVLATPTAPSGADVRAQASATAAAAAETARTAALERLLAARGAAVLSGDRAAWLATVDPAATGFRARQAEVFDNLTGVPFEEFTYTVASVAPELPAQRQRELGGPSWVARVLAGYRLRGFDRSTTETEQTLTAVWRSGRWYLAADTDGTTHPQPWDLGPVRVAVRDDVLAMGTASAATLQQYADQAHSALGRVSGVWGSSWPRRAVLVVPRTQEEMGRLLQRDTGLEQIAAVTVGALPPGGGPAGSDRVVVNPGAFDRLEATGRRVVLTHELTHVAVRSSTTAPVPIWLSEGFADYVGYLGVDLGPQAVAAELLARTRRGEGFAALPTDQDFDATRTTIGPAYSASWLAASLVAERYGQDALVRLYRTAATTAGDDPETALSEAFTSVLGVTHAQVSADWLQRVDQLARN
jgi:hypothetical protein